MSCWSWAAFTHSRAFDIVSPTVPHRCSLRSFPSSCRPSSVQDVEARMLDTDCAMVMACSTAYPVLSSLGAERFLNWVFPRRKLLQHHRHGWRNRVSEETAGKKCAGFERSSGSFTQCIGWQTLVPRLSVPASTRRLAAVKLPSGKACLPTPPSSKLTASSCTCSSSLRPISCSLTQATNFKVRTCAMVLGQ